ncbi:hypothetical protein DXG01_010850 [Tephrocybe rancida]|nr:hypothetical protein DXG01_010850 [Tephrocybe rancida]
MLRNEKIPRPPNSFIVYRSHVLRTMPAPLLGTKRNQSDLSKTIGEMWRNESPEVRAQFERRAAVLKKEHEEAYPGYQYAPRREGDVPVPRANFSRKASKANGIGPSTAPYPVPVPVQNTVPSSASSPKQLATNGGSDINSGSSESLVFNPTFDFYPPYRYGCGVGFDDMGAYAVEEPYIDSWGDEEVAAYVNGHTFEQWQAPYPYAARP